MMKKTTEELVIEYRGANGINKEIILEELLKRTEPAFYKMSAMYSNIPNTEDEDRREVMTLAFLKALDTFDISKGYKFSTLCRNYFEQALNKLWRDNRRDKRCITDEEGSVVKTVSYEMMVEVGQDTDEPYDVSSGEMAEYSLVEINDVLNSLDLSEKELLTCKYIMMDTKKGDIAKMLGVSNTMIGLYLKNVKKKFIGQGLYLEYIS